MRIEFTETGGRLLLASIVVVLWGALFIDYLLIGVGLLGLGFLGYRYIGIRGQLRELPEQASFNPNVVDASFTAGSKYSETLSVESNSPTELRISLPYGELQPPFLRTGKQTRNYFFKPSLAANYRFKEVSAEVTDSLNLLRGETELSLNCSFKVFPRVFSVSLDALQYLEGQGILGAGEQTSTVKGRGYEYADSREYVEGDDLRQIDWKATARLGKFIVKEYYTEGSGAVHIIYDVRVSDPVSADVLAASYLQTVLSFAERGWVIGLTVLDDGVCSHFPELYSGFAVSVALRHVLETHESKVMSYYDLLDPAYNARIRRILADRLPEAKTELGVLKDELYGSKYGGVVYITSLAGNPSDLIELNYTARTSRSRFVVLEPCTPWRYTGLENAYRVWSQIDKVNRSLLRSGTPIAINLDEAQLKLGELEPIYL